MVFGITHSPNVLCDQGVMFTQTHDWAIAAIKAKITAAHAAHAVIAL